MCIFVNMNKGLLLIKIKALDYDDISNTEEMNTGNKMHEKNGNIVSTMLCKASKHLDSSSKNVETCCKSF